MAHVPRSTARLPGAPAGHVRRPALEAVLEHGAERDLVLLSAPPGSGKTSLLAVWLADDLGRATAWVCLEPADRDPERFRAAVLRALRGLSVIPASSRLHRVGSSLAELTEALAALPTPVRLVLDDVHHLVDPLSGEAIATLLRDAGPGFRLVLAGRRAPSLPLPRLRMDERVTELRAGDLAFSPEESATLLAAEGLHLDPAQVAVLHERTGGWVTGLRLAARSLRDHPDTGAFLAGFPGNDRRVADFLADEVLAGVPAPRREVLRRIGVAAPVPAALAVALTGRADAAEELDALAHETGLVGGTGAPYDGYRLPELLRSHLVAGLGRDRRAELDAVAAVWWSEQGEPVEALRHATRTGNPALVADLVGRRGPWLAGRGEHEVLAAALDAASGSAAPGSGDDARLATAAAHVHLARGEPGAARAALRRARRDRTPGPDTAAFRAATEQLLGRRPPAAHDATDPDATDPAVAAHLRIARGTTALLADHPDRARAELTAGLATADRLGLDVLAHRARCLLAAALWTVGDVPRSREAAEKVLAEPGVDPGPWTAIARAVAAHGSLLHGDPVAARATAGDAVPVTVPAVRLALRCARGAAAVDLGERTAGLLELQAARTDLGDAAIPGALAVTAALLEHRAALDLGHTTAAAAVTAWLAGRRPRGPATHSALALIRGRTALAAGAPSAARAELVPLLARHPRPSPDALDVEAWLLESDGRLAREDRPGAREAARHAVRLAEPVDALRPFAHAGRGVRALLVDELAAGTPRAGFVARALAAGAASPTGIALSVREHDVLARLPSLESLDEIAGDLDVSINTIKTHVRALYGKLGVTTRRDAVLVAHEQGLLG
jgi:LuxR family transcriptional regulator, maltose regulon positive regulatory protein